MISNRSSSSEPASPSISSAESRPQSLAAASLANTSRPSGRCAVIPSPTLRRIDASSSGDGATTSASRMGSIRQNRTAPKEESQPHFGISRKTKQNDGDPLGG